MKKTQKKMTKVKQKPGCDLLLTGTGSLAQSMMLAWPTVGRAGVRQRVVIVSRSAESARQLASLANLRAAAAGCDLDCEGAATNWEEADVRRLLEQHRPRVIVHAASLQSPWAKGDADSDWRQGMRQLGFGITTALQAPLAFVMGRAAQAAAPDAALVNCCYPDAVNPLLAAAGIPITCGAGNVSIVAAVWRSRTVATAPVRILAHHAHLTQLVRPGTINVALPRIWIGKAECHEVQEKFGKVQFPEGKGMNHLTGAVTAVLAQALLGGVAVRTHVPGPGGLVGGYPVIAKAGKVTLDLPAGLTEKQAIAFNEQSQLAEGIASIGQAGLRYIAPIAEELKRRGSRFAEGFAADQVVEAAADMLAMRERMGGDAP